MLQRLLIVTAGIVGKLQLNRQVALVAYIFQSLDNGSIITNTAAGRNISSGNRVVILTVDIEDTLTAQHVNSPFRIDMLVDQMIGIQLDAEIVITHILQHLQDVYKRQPCGTGYNRPDRGYWPKGRHRACRRSRPARCYKMCIRDSPRRLLFRSQNKSK